MRPGCGGRPDRGLAALAAAVVLAALAASCAPLPVRRDLDPDSREFLSKARYVITRAERRTFLAIPAAERPAFIEEFWKKRDPDPDTEENEFRTEYFKRIEEANRLFTEGEPGWLQDRGRIYILLGPPMERHAYPRGVTFYGKPTEYWYYGFFPIVFVDEAWNGNYRLDPTSAVQLAEIMKTQMMWKPQIAPEKGVIDFALRAKRAGPGKAVVRVEVPYRAIWFSSEEKDLRTTFRLRLELLDPDGRSVWVGESEHPVSLTEEELADRIRDDYVIEVPIAGGRGEYWLGATLENGADSSQASRKIKIKL